MALKVRVNTGPAPNNTTVKKVLLPLVDLEELKNVNTTDLQDGYTLIWNENSQEWVSQVISTGASNIDGGTY